MATYLKSCREPGPRLVGDVSVDEIAKLSFCAPGAVWSRKVSPEQPKVMVKGTQKRLRLPRVNHTKHILLIVREPYRAVLRADWELYLLPSPSRTPLRGSPERYREQILCFDVCFVAPVGNMLLLRITLVWDRF